MTTPFIVYSLPRSRSAWMSSFLTYKNFECFHEPEIFFRSVPDVKDFLNSGNVGCASTGSSYGHQLIRHMAPNIKEVVILRPVDEVVYSLLKLDIQGVAKYDNNILRRNMNYGYRCLLKIAERRDTLVFNYNELNNEQTCKRIFEHCLPYEFDREHYLALCNKNIQIDFKAFLSYYIAHRKEIDKFKRDCRQELWRLAREGVIRSDMKEVKYG